MNTRLFFVALVQVIIVIPALADSTGTAGGSGIIERFIPGDPDGNTEKVSFTPRFSYAYTEGTGAKQSTWIVLTDKEPPAQEQLKAPDPVEARRAWCGSAKASFVALKLDAKSAVDLFYLCPADGSTNMEMLSGMNGLDSVVVKFDTKSDTRLKGTLTGGQGSCPDAEGNNKYCEQRSDYTFDTPLGKR